MATTEEVLVLKTKFTEENGDLPKKIARDYEKLSAALINQAVAAKKADEARISGNTKAAAAAEKSARREEEIANNLANKIEDAIDREIKKKEDAEKRKLAAAQKANKLEIEARIKAQKILSDTAEALDQEAKRSAGIIGGLEKKIEELNELITQEKNPANLVKLNKELKDTEAKLSLNKNATTSFGLEVGNLTAKFGPAVAGIGAITAAAGALFAGLGKIVVEGSNAARSQANLQKTAQVSAELAGAAIAGLQQFGISAEEASRDAADALLQLGQRAQAGGDEFEKLGIKGAQLKSIETIFREITAQAEKTGLSQQKLIQLSAVLGEDSAKKLLPLLDKFSEIEKRAIRTGQVFSKEALAGFEAFRTQGIEASAKVQGTFNLLASSLVGSFNDVLKAGNKAFDELANNEDTRIIIKGLIDEVNGFISAVGPALIELLKDVAEGLVNIAGTFQAILNPLDVLGVFFDSFITVNKEAAKAQLENAQATQKAIDFNNQASSSIAAFNEQLKKQTEIEQASADLQSSLADLRINALEIGIEQGKIIEFEAIEEINQRRKEAADKQVEVVENTFRKTVEFVDKQKAIFQSQFDARIKQLREEEFAGTKTIEQANEERRRLKEDLAKASRQFEKQIADAGIASANAIAKRDQELANQRTRNLQLILQQSAPVATEIATQFAITNAEIAELLDQRVIDEKEAANRILDNEVAIAKASVQVETERLFTITKAFGEFTEQTNGQRTALAQAEEKFANASRARRLKDLEDQKKERDVLFAQNEALHETELIRIKEAFDRRKKLSGITKDQEIKNELEILAVKIRSINDAIANKELDIQKLIEEKKEQTEINRLLAEKRQLENQGRELRNEEIKQIKEKTKAVADAGDALREENKRVEDLASRELSAAANGGKIVAILNEIANSVQITFDPKNFDQSGLEDAKNQLEEYQKILAQTNEEIFSGGKVFSVLYKAQQAIYEDAVAELQKRIGEAEVKQQIETANKIAAERRKAEITANIEALKDAKEFLKEREELEKEHAENVREIKQELADAEQEIEDQKNDEIKENRDNLEELEQESNNRRIAEEQRLADAIVQANIDANQRIADIGRAERKGERADRVEAALDIADLEKEIAEKQAEFKAELDQKNRQKLAEDIAVLEAKVKQLRVEDEEKKKLQGERDKTIADAQTKLNEDLAKATTQAEIDAAKARFEAVVDAANERLDIELKYQKDKARAIASGSEEALKIVEEAHKQEIEDLENTEAQKQKTIEDTLKFQQAILARQKAAEETAYQERVADENRRHDETLARIDQEGKDRIDAIKAKLKEENQEYRKQQEEISERLAETLADLGAQLGLATDQLDDYFKKVLATIGLVGPEVDKIVKQIEAITNATQLTIDQATDAAENTTPGSGIGGNNQTTGDGGILGGPGNGTPTDTTTGDNSDSSSGGILGNNDTAGQGGIDNGGGGINARGGGNSNLLKGSNAEGSSSAPSGNASTVEGYRKLLLDIFKAYKPGKIKNKLSEFSRQIRQATIDLSVGLDIATGSSDIPQGVLVRVVGVETALANKGLIKDDREQYAAAVESVINIALSLPPLNEATEEKEPPPPASGGDREKGKEKGTRGKQVIQEPTGSVVVDTSNFAPKSKADIGRGDTQFGADAAAEAQAQRDGFARAGATVADRGQGGSLGGGGSIAENLVGGINVSVIGTSAKDIISTIIAALPAIAPQLDDALKSFNQQKQFNRNPGRTVKA